MSTDVNRDAHEEIVKKYYAVTLQTNDDLQTTACCSPEDVPEYHKPYLAAIHDEVLEKFYGCGSPVPEALENLTILDLGCGSGRDVYLLSALAGENGKVIGLDMTPEQLEIARKHQNFHAEAFGHAAPNTEFITGNIEDLKSAGIEDNSIDLVVSNCVLNLAADKKNVFREIFRVLKPGAELYFSDVFSDRRLSERARNDEVLIGECLGGALYIEDFRRIMFENNIADFREVSRSPIEITWPDLKALTGRTRFESITYRAFKLPLEDRCEDYGQAVRYKGGITGFENAFRLDDHHLFETGKWYEVCGNTADMISMTRLGPYFDLVGDKSMHYGLFDCAPVSGQSTEDAGDCGC